MINFVGGGGGEAIMSLPNSSNLLNFVMVPNTTGYFFGFRDIPKAWAIIWTFLGNRQKVFLVITGITILVHLWPIL